MRAIGMAFCRFAEENPGSYRLITVVVQPVPALGPRAEGHPAARVQKILQRAIADCQAAGLAADVDPEVLRFLPVERVARLRPAASRQAPA